MYIIKVYVIHPLVLVQLLEVWNFMFSRFLKKKVLSGILALFFYFSNQNLCNLFFEDYSSDFPNFADDTTLYEYGPTLNEIMNNFETTTKAIIE